MDADWIKKIPIAHRGLHDHNAVENSVSAIKLAIKNGYAIECDVQNTKTEPIVFHDPNMERLTGVNQNVGEMTLTEIKNIKLQNGDAICSLKEFLGVVNKTVPAIVEIKDENMDEKYIQKIEESVRGYEGEIALMSFNAEIVRQIKNSMPNVVRGLVAKGNDDTYNEHKKNVEISQPHFISYNVDDLPNKFITEMKQKMPVITWTVKNQHQKEVTEKYAHQMTFEGFRP